MSGKKAVQKVQAVQLAEKLYELLNKNSELKIKNLSSESKAAVLDLLETIRIFGGVLAEKKRLDLFPEILSELKELVSGDAQDNAVIVKSAVELDAENMSRLKTKLEKIFGKELVVNLVVEEELIGGLIIQYKDKIIDLSLEKQIKVLKENLKK